MTGPHRATPGDRLAAALRALVVLLLCYPGMLSAALVPPALDDRSYEALVREAMERIPVHNPEWTDFNDSDPGVTLLELFDGLGIAGINALVDEFREVPPWRLRARNDQTYWRELGYVTMEAGLALIASNHAIGSSWPQTLWPDTYQLVLEQQFDTFQAYATVPLPSALPLLALAGGLLARAGHRRARCSGGT